MKSKQAWIVRWDTAATDRDGIVPGRIITFLDFRLSDQSVIKIIKSLWVSHSRLLWHERLVFAIRPNRMTPNFVLKQDGRILVGVRPRIEARIVSDIEAIDDDQGGTVSWTELWASGSKRIQQENLPHPS